MKIIANYLIFALPFGVVWVILTNIFSIESFLIGWSVGLIVVYLGVRSGEVEFNISHLLGRIWAFFAYSVFMTWQIWISGWDMALRVFGLRPVRPGIVAVPIGDESNNEFIAGASAHSITITPGEQVVEYDKTCKVMYVHCVDVEESLKTLESAQAYRLSYFKRIIGK